jgi:hypothetical protein
MLKPFNTSETRDTSSFIDILLYLLTGAVMTIISISFLLWLRF